jgi:hypothetical protein
MKDKVLVISHREKQCGVYQYGRSIADALTRSAQYDFIYTECANEKDLLSIVKTTGPVAIIYNYHPATLPWLNLRTTGKIKVPQIEIIHEVTQQVADAADISLFDYHVAADPTLQLNNPTVFKTGRLLPKYENKYLPPDVPTIGSFGFGTAGKGFEKLITTVQDEFDEAVIRLHIPFAAFADADGTAARAIAQRCKELIHEPKIKLLLSHDFLSQQQLLDFLAQNSMNAFFYEENKGRGISSVIDFALAVQRPIAITKSNMFRHLSSAYPSVCIEDSSLKQILKNGCEPLMPYVGAWSESNLVRDYENIIKTIISNSPKTVSKKIKQGLMKTFYRFKYGVARAVHR